MSLEKQLEQTNTHLAKLRALMENKTVEPVKTEAPKVEPKKVNKVADVDMDNLQEAPKPKKVKAVVKSTERAELKAKAEALGIEVTSKISTANLKKKIEKAQAPQELDLTVSNAPSDVEDPFVEATPKPEVLSESEDLFGTEEAKDEDRTLNNEETAEATELLRRFLAKFIPEKGKDIANGAAKKLLTELGANKVSDLKFSAFPSFKATLAKYGIK